MRILEEYKSTKQAIDILTEELKALKPEVVKSLKACEDGKAEIEGASFNLRSKKTYNFTKAVTSFETLIDKKNKDLTTEIKANKKSLKELEDKEIKEELATLKSETFVPVMNIIKGDK